MRKKVREIQKRKEKIYLVTCGEYSDYHVVGFCTSKYDAEKICKLLNRVARRDRGGILDWERCRVEECKSMDKIAASTLVAKQRFDVKVLNDGRVFEDSETEFVLPGIRPVASRIDNGVLVKVWLDKADRKKAIKIATDVAAEFKAKEAGI